MSPIHAITPVYPTREQVSPLAAKAFAALCRLTKERVEHHCGGFTTDDMKWQMGAPFTDIAEAIDELESARLIRFVAFDDNAAESACSCYAINSGL
jgi:hypothetical protein